MARCYHRPVTSSGQGDSQARRSQAGGSNGATAKAAGFLGAIYAFALVGLSTPLVSTAWSGELTILGLPRSIAWVILMLLLVFVAVLQLYRADLEAERADSPSSGRGGWRRVDGSES